MIGLIWKFQTAQSYLPDKVLPVYLLPMNRLLATTQKFIAQTKLQYCTQQYDMKRRLSYQETA